MEASSFASKTPLLCLFTDLSFDHLLWVFTSSLPELALWVSCFRSTALGQAHASGRTELDCLSASRFLLLLPFLLPEVKSIPSAIGLLCCLLCLPRCAFYQPLGLVPDVTWQLWSAPRGCVWPWPPSSDHTVPAAEMDLFTWAYSLTHSHFCCARVSGFLGQRLWGFYISLKFEFLSGACHLVQPPKMWWWHKWILSSYVWEFW